MIDLACIFTTGGVILFYKAFCTMKFDVLDVLVKKVLIQDRVSETKYFIDPYNVKWKLANDLNLVFCVVYQEIFQVLYVDELLDLLKATYIKTAYPNISVKNNIYFKVPEFEEEFSALARKWELQNQKTAQKDKIMRSFEQTSKGKEKGKLKQQDKEKDKPKSTSGTTTATANSREELDEGEDGSGSEEGASPSHGNQKSSDGSPKKQIDVLEERKKLEERFRKSGKKTTEKKTERDPEKKPTKKEATSWGISNKVDAKTMKQLSYSEENTTDDAAAKKQYLGDEGEPEEIKKAFVEDDEEIVFSDEDDNKSKGKNKKGLFSRFSSGIKNLTGNKTLDAEDLEPILQRFKEGLMEKNVAEEIAKKVCDSVKLNLIDRKTKAFTSFQTTVKECLVESLTKILTPKRHIDIIAEAMRKKDKGRPYVLVFIGVNGVGKSTNLAKVAYLLKSQGFSIMLAACDNFRSGAVEQLKTHGRCLEVPVYDKGYKDDPANIAREAIEEAARKKIDCVLIDTAGRMQDNEPLMRALAKLVAVNQPDLIVFVGEALVGNDAVDQLGKFNQALIDLSAKDSIREIDAILLTKFDTVDEKVGAAVSMTYTTGKPVLFCGTGQKYTHLRKLNIKTVVHALLS